MRRFYDESARNFQNPRPKTGRRHFLWQLIISQLSLKTSSLVSLLYFSMLSPFRWLAARAYLEMKILNDLEMDFVTVNIWRWLFI